MGITQEESRNESSDRRGTKANISSEILARLWPNLFGIGADGLLKSRRHDTCSSASMVETQHAASLRE